MRRRLRHLLTLVLFALAVGAALARPPIEWEGQFLVRISTSDSAPVTIGSETRRYYPATLDGQEVQAYESSATIQLNVMGTSVSVIENTTSYTGADGAPLRLESGMGTGDEGTQEVVAIYYPDRVDYTRRAGDDVSEGTVEIPEGISLADPDCLFDPGSMTIGEKITLHAFEPMSLAIQLVALTNEGRETISVGGGTTEAWRLLIDSETMGPTSLWVDDEGFVLRTTYDVGEIVFSVDRASADEMAQFESSGVAEIGDTPDLIEGTAVRPDVLVPRPRDCRELTVRVLGVDRERLLISDVRQAYSEVTPGPDGELTGLLTIRAAGPPAERPLLSDTPPEEVQPYLASTATVQSADERFLEIAARIVGDETDPWVVAGGIAEWVDDQMTPDMGEPLLRSSLEVLDSPAGACRSYAALYCAVARAAGIPCRIAVGAVYVTESLGGDAFAFHAWNEVWVGEWVAVDSTLFAGLPMRPADATHIKFAHGDVRAFAPAARVIRSLDLRVIDADTIEKAIDEPEAQD